MTDPRTSRPSESAPGRSGPARTRSWGIRALRVIGYGVAAIGLPAIVGAIGVGDVTSRLHSGAEPFGSDAESGPPAHDPDKPTAVVLLSNVWTEATDFLGPYEVLATSGAYNVYAVAPEKELTPLNGAVDVLPHYTIEQFRAAGLQADVLVVPYVAEIHGEANRPLLDWIAAHADRGGTVLSICAGAEVVAASGALDGRRGTTIWMSVDALAKEYPNTEWIRGMRYVDDGTIISSAGVTSGIDATFYLLKREMGEALATRVARDLGYPHTHFMNDPIQPASYGIPDVAPMALHAAFEWDRPVLGVGVRPGVTELELASIADTYTPAVAKVVTVAEERSPIDTANGLQVVPRYSFMDAPRLDRLLIAGREEDPSMATWAAGLDVPLEAPHADLASDGSRYPFDAIMLDLAERSNPAIAKATAASIEYPIEHLQLPGSGAPWRLMVRPLLLAIAGVAAVLAMEAAVGTHRRSRASRARAARLRRST